MKKRIFLTVIIVILMVGEDMFAGESPHLSWSYHQERCGDIGLILIAFGLLIRSWAAGTLQKNISLCMTGPYAITRNPLYLGSMLLMLGFCSLIGDWDNCVALSFLGALIYWPKIKNEETSLSNRFGATWDQYARRTPRLLPTRLRWRGAFREWSWRRWLTNREYKAVIGALVALVGIGIWHAIASG